MTLQLQRVFIFSAIFLATFFSSQAQTVVNSLAELRSSMLNSNQEILMTAGDYYLEDLPSGSRVLNCSGSNNIIDLTGVRINTLVGSIREVYFIISGDDNILRNGAIEDFYKSGLEEVTDFSAYNNDRDELAYGLKGAPIMSVTGNRNLVVGLEMIVKGSFPYGYGSQYGIGSKNTFGLNKRCGILITGTEGGGIGNTLDSITMYHHAFGHGIYMQSGATETTIKNCYVEGRMRLSKDMYNDTATYDLPYRTNYLFPADEAESWKEADMPWAASYPIPMDVMYPLSEDGIRSYSNTGSVTVENCTIKQMRGGIRLYLASSATVSNSTAIDCGATNYNMPAGSSISGSSGNFSYAPLSDFRLDRSRQNIEMTILPSPNAIGPHNLADVLGSDHEIVFHRTPGPVDTTTRPIVIYGNNSTIINETEYTIILEPGTSGNTIISCGPVVDNGDNSITLNDCDFDLETPRCTNTATLTQAECFDEVLTAKDEGENIGSIRNGYWAMYSNLDLTDMNSVVVSASSKGVGGTIEFRLDAVDGELIGTVEVGVTGDWNNWESFSSNITRVEGVHDVYTVFTGDDGWLYNVDYFGFSEDVICNPTPSHIEAECFDNMSGIQTEPCDEGTLNVGWIQNGDWIMYNKIDLTGMNSIKARVSGKTTGSIIEVRLDAVDGTLIGEIPVSNTDGNQNWVTDSVNIQATTGEHDIYLVFTGGDGYLYNINWFGFSEESTTITGLNNESRDLDLYPNPTSGIVNLMNNKGAVLKVYNSLNQVLLTTTVSSENTQIDLSKYTSGIYYLQILHNGSICTLRVIKH